MIFVVVELTLQFPLPECTTSPPGRGVWGEVDCTERLWGEVKNNCIFVNKRKIISVSAIAPLCQMTGNMLKHR